jgi:hypothetical protein
MQIKQIQEEMKMKGLWHMRERLFWEDEVEKAKEYFDAPEECETLEDIADWYNHEQLPIFDNGALEVR